MRDLIKLIEWGFANEGTFVVENDSGSENDRMVKKWMMRAVVLFGAKLDVFKATSHLNMYEVDEAEARHEVEVCVKKAKKAQDALVAEVRHTQTKGSHRRRKRRSLAHSVTFFFFLSALSHDQNVALGPIPDHVKTPPPESEFVVVKRGQLEREQEIAKPKSSDSEPQPMEDSPQPGLRYDWMTSQQRAAIAKAQSAPQLPADAPSNLVALDAQRRKWLKAMEEREKRQGTESDEPADFLEAQQELWDCWIRAVRSKRGTALTIDAGSESVLDQFLIVAF